MFEVKEKTAVNTFHVDGNRSKSWKGRFRYKLSLSETLLTLFGSFWGGTRDGFRNWIFLWT